MTASVLIVDDEPSFTEALVVALDREGFTVTVAADGAEALRRFDEVEPDLVLLDVMLPNMSGIDVCRALRAKSRVPIIMVSAKGAEVDTVVGLEVGADDYVTKPHRFRELVARMRAVLRRAEALAEPESAATSKPVIVGGVSLDVERHEVMFRGDEVPMPLKEFALLTALMQNAGRVVTRDQLIDRVWGHDYVGDDTTLDVHIERLRKKIELDPEKPELIVTIHGLGYRFEDA